VVLVRRSFRLTPQGNPAASRRGMTKFTKKIFSISKNSSYCGLLFKLGALGGGIIRD
jgi:hypothetical protein